MINAHIKVKISQNNSVFKDRLGANVFVPCLFCSAPFYVERRSRWGAVMKFNFFL